MPAEHPSTSPSVIRYAIGDATNPGGKGPKIIAHVSNDLGRWGKGIVLAISRKWPEPEREFRAWYASGDDFGLGRIQVVRVTPHIEVANMVGQKGVQRRGKRSSSGPPIRYDALERCLESLTQVARDRSASVHMPRIGAGLAGGRWELIEPIIERTLVAGDVPTTVYTLGSEAARWADDA